MNSNVKSGRRYASPFTSNYLHYAYSRLALPLITAMLISGCKKDRLLSASELLSNSKWKIDNVIAIDSNENQTIVIDACSKDNKLYFNANNELIMDYGEMKCDSSEKRVIYTWWLLVENDTKIDLGGLTYEIALLNKDYFRFALHNYPIQGLAGIKLIYFMYKRLESN